MNSNRGVASAIRAARTARKVQIAGSSRCASSSSYGKGKAKATTSSSSPPSTAASDESEWTPALPPGKSEAYDISLRYLQSHRDNLLSKVSRLESKASSTGVSTEIDRLTVEAYVNDPATRRLFRDTNGESHMDKVVMRHLAERRWKKEGGLDLLMQRVHQLGVVPDLLPSLSGSVAALRLLDGKGKEVEPGIMELPSQWSGPPDLRVQLFNHPSSPTSSTPFPTALFTLLVIDPDSPTHETQSFSQRLLYAKSGIPLSVLSGSTNLLGADLGEEVLSYEPPLPAQGTGKHRYVFLLLRQPSKAPTEREKFDLRSYLLENSLTADDVVALTLFRSKWTAEESEYINQAYLKYHGTEVPVYGKPPKDMRYGYPMSAKGQRAEGIRQQAWNEAIAGSEDVGAEVEELEGRAAMHA